MNQQSFDLNRALVFMFQEEDWVRKFGIACGLFVISIPLFFLLFIPYLIPQFFLFGYVIDIIRRVADGRSPELPEWDRWGEYFKDGALAMLGSFIYSLPMLALVCVITVISALAEEGGELAGTLTLLLCCAMLLMLLLILPILALYTAALAHFANRRQFSAFFDFVTIWRQLRSHVGTYGTAFLTIVIVNLVGGFVPIFGQVWAYLATGHALGQLVREWRPGTAEATTVPPG